MIPEKGAITTTIEGKSVILILNEEILLPTRNIEFNISLPIEFNNWQIRVAFTDNLLDKEEYKSTTEFENGGHTIVLTYYGWNGLSAIETNGFHILTSANNNLKLYIKMRTYANLDRDRRSAHICIWKEI